MSSSYYPAAFCFNLKDFSISFRDNLLVIQSLSFCLFENVLISPLFLKVLPDIEFLIEFSFSFSTFKYVIPLPSRLHGFWWKIGYWSYCRALVHDKLLPSCFFLQLFLCLLRIWLWCVLMWVCKFILHEVHWTWICRFMSSSTNLGNVQLLSIQIFVLAFPLLFWNFLNACCYC